MRLLSIRPGHSPNCSATGSVVGLVLVSAGLAQAVLNGWADRVARAGDDDEGQPKDDGVAEPPAVREEHFGAIAAWPDGQVLLDGPVAGRRVGTGVPVPGALTAPLEAHISWTERCPVACSDCYLEAGPDRAPVTDAEAVRARLRELAQQGVFQVALGGGELAMDDTVLELAAEVRALGMLPNLTTSGFGLTEDRARALAACMGQINVSWDGPAYAELRGFDGSAVARRAVTRLVAAGARVGVNTVLARPVLPHLEAFGTELRALGIAEWQWLRLKPAGRARAHYADLTPTPEERAQLWPRLLDIEAATALTMRIDCALVPFLAQHELDPGRMAKLGVQGCPGGTGLLAVHADGSLSPCSFASERTQGPLSTAWRSAPALSAWRGALPEPCGSCAYQTVCRGGCRVVSAALTGDPLAPDPECSRVMAYGSQQKRSPEGERSQAKS